MWCQIDPCPALRPTALPVVGSNWFICWVRRMRAHVFDDELQKLRTQIAFQEETIAMLREYGQSTSIAEKDLKRLQEDLALLHETEQSRDLPGGRLRKT